MQKKEFITIKAIYILWRIISFIPNIILSITYHPIASRLSRKQLPKVCDKLGLAFTKSKNYYEFGEFNGIFRGYNVSLKPDEGAKIIVFLNSEKQLQLWTAQYRAEPSEDMPVFPTNNWIFNHIFKTRRADLQVARIFNNSTTLIDSFIQFYIRWMRTLNSLYVSDQAIFCTFNYGHPFFPYIPPFTLERILNEIVDLGVQLDSNLQ